MTSIAIGALETASGLVDNLHQTYQTKSDDEKQECSTTPDQKNTPNQNKTPSSLPKLTQSPSDQSTLPSPVKQPPQEPENRSGLHLDLKGEFLSPTTDPVVSPLTERLNRLMQRGKPIYDEHYETFLDSTFAMSQSHVDKIGPESSPLEMMTVVLPDYCFQGINGSNGCTSSTPGKHQIMVTLRAPESMVSELHAPYKPTHSDYEFSERFNKIIMTMLSRLGVKNDPGRIRLFTVVQCFINPQFNPVVYLILYNNLIVWAEIDDGVEMDGSFDLSKSRIVFLIRLDQEHFELKVDTNDERMVNMKIGENKLPFTISFLGSEIAYLFADMVDFNHLNVPLHPEEFADYCQTMRQELMPLVHSRGITLANVVSHRRLLTVMCLPLHLFEDSQFLLTIWSRISDMDINENLCLVIYSPQGVHYVTGFMDSDLENWRLAMSMSFLSKKTTANNYGEDDFSEFSTDTLLRLCSNLLGQTIDPKCMSTVILVTDDDLPLNGDIPMFFLEHSVNVCTIGITGNHNVEALTRISESVEGEYAYLENLDGLHNVLTRYQDFTHRGFLKDVTVRMRLRLHTQLIGATYIDSYYQTLKHTFINDGLELEWNIGKMYAGETRTFFIHFEGELPPQQPAIRYSVFYDDFFGDRVRPINAVHQVRAPFLKRHLPVGGLNQEPKHIIDLVQSEYQLMVGYKRMVSLLNILLHEKDCMSVFSVMNYIKHLENLDLGPDFDTFIYKLKRVCTSQLEHATKDRFVRRDRICELIRDIWALRSRRSMTDFDNFGNFFQI